MSSLEDLLTFNDEIAALSRAGVPLDVGLAQLDPDPDIAKKLINGAITRQSRVSDSLVDAISEDDQSFPPVYQGVVCAGLRCGRLPAALEAMSRYLQPVHDTRQTFRSSLVYPTVICLIAYVLFVGSCLYLWPQYDRMFAVMDSGGGAFNAIVGALREWLPYWVAIPPVLLIVALAWRWRSKSSHTIGFGRSFWLWKWVPVVSGVAIDQCRARLAELLALLVEHDAGLPEALRLAAPASGDDDLASAVRQLADELDRGQSLSHDSEAARQLPPFLYWALTSAPESGGRAQSLRIAASVYRHRAQRRAESLRVIVPTVTCVALAGGATLFYCLSIFSPFVQMIRGLS